MPLITPPEIEIEYPDCDGNPMSDNTRQFRFIVLIKENLEMLYATDMDVFIAGDLLWYPIEDDNKTRLAPDIMVAFGRPKGDRGSYQQWKEGGTAPQIALVEMEAKTQQAQQQVRQAEQQVRQVVVNLLRSGMSIEQVSTLSGVSIDRITEFQTQSN